MNITVWKDTIKKAIYHFRMITKHRHYVFKNCVKAKLYWQGLTHDLSKYSPTEFFESVKYYTGTSSPIDACKKTNGWSKAWLHHKGRNKHHYEYWQDNFDRGGSPIQMPFKYALECVCDYIAAGQAYMGKNFTYEKELEWWKTKSNLPLAMHPQTKNFINQMMHLLAVENANVVLDKNNAYKIYQQAEKDFKAKKQN